MSREACTAALFALLAGLKTRGTVKLADRRVRFIEEMAPSELPALFLVLDHGEVKPQSDLPPRRILGAKVILYAANPDRARSAGVVLNGLIDAVEAALAPTPPSERQTLGGLVAHAWVEGTIEVFEGPAGERAAAIVPVRLLVP